MILVLNLNASVDKRYMLDDFVPGTVMRAPSVSNTAGGKGIHVARVASLLGEETLTTGFFGGKTGEFIEERLRRVGLPGDFVKVEGATRSCRKSRLLLSLFDIPHFYISLTKTAWLRLPGSFCVWKKEPLMKGSAPNLRGCAVSLQETNRRRSGKTLHRVLC